MKRIFLMLTLGAGMALVGCNDHKVKEDNPGVEIEGKHGGSMDLNKDELDIEGKKGGGLKIDDDKLKIEGKKGGELRIDDDGIKTKSGKKD